MTRLRFMTADTVISSPVEFADSARWEAIPPGSWAALYADGEFAAPQSAQRLFRGVRHYTVWGNWRIAKIIDWEPGNPCFTPAALRRFVRGRRALGEDAVVYCDRADAAEALAALHDFGHGELANYSGLMFDIATLDGADWSAIELADDLARNWDAPIPAAAIWANQYVTRAGPDGPYDVSRLFGRF